MFLLLPSGAFANVVIHEIMYDLDGTDTDREWIEVRNTGTASVDIASFKLFEANVSHALVSVQGNTVLAPGEVAVIAAHPAAFLTDWPTFSGRLFDSSFSLSNTGETLGIKNGTGGEEDSVTYASSMGAQGDGNSLVRSGNTFVPQTPTPGVADGHSASFATTPNASGTAGGGLPSSVSAANVRTISVHAGGARTVTVGADSMFTADVYGTEGKLASDARVIWTFGNGDAKEGRSVTHLYPYPGRYLVSVVGVLGEYSAETRFVVEATPADVLLRVETDGALSVLHQGEGTLDISLWQVERAGVWFRFPRRTLILPGEGVRLSPKVSGLPAEGTARLLYPNGDEVTLSEPALERVFLDTQPTVSQEMYAPLFVVPPQDDEEPLKEEIPATIQSESVAAAAYAIPEEGGSSQSSILLWLAGALSISVLGAGVVVWVRAPHLAKHPATAGKEAEEYQLL